MTQQRPLSERQQTILQFITDEIYSRGYAPTVREIVAHVGDKSPTSVHRHLKTLAARGYIDREENKSRSIRLADEYRGLPLEGLVTDDTPIEEADESERFDLTEMFEPKKHFVLRVTGDSMIGDHIEDGDLIICRRQSTCSNGDTIVCILDEEDQSLRRYYRNGRQVRLESANSSTKTVKVDKARVKIEGVVVAVLRHMST